VAIGGVLAFSMSYSRNRTYISETATELAKMDQVPPVAADARLEALLPRLNTLRTVVDTANRYRDDTPWAMRWGLYQGTSLGKSSRDAYVRELDGTLLPRVAARIEERLVEFAPQPEKLYEYLKAYIMLGEPKHLDMKHLQFVSDLEWHAADNADPNSAAALSKHFQSLLDYSDGLRPIAMNPSLLAQARSTVRQASIPRIIYGRLKRNYKEDVARAVRLDLAAGIGVEEVMRRKSGVKLSEPVPSLYSRAVFQEMIDRRIPDVVKEFSADDWVWGEGGGTAAGAPRFTADVIDLYERDYIDAWEGVLKDIELVPFSTAAQAMDVLEKLSRPSSPLRGLLQAVSDNTYLIQPADGSKPGGVEGAAAAAKKALEDRAQKLNEKLGGLFGTKDGKPARMPGMLVTATFQPIHRLMAGEPGNAPIDRVLVRIGQVQRQIKTQGLNPGSLGDPGLREILQSLAQETEMLPPVVQGVVEQIGRKAENTVVAGAANELERRYRQDILGECNQAITGRYPFTPNSSNDLPPSDFSRLFNHGGVFDKFFNENLDALVDRSQSPWTWRSGAPQGTRVILDHFEKAMHIRDTFFRPGTSALELRFQLTLAEADSSSIRFLLEIDGQAMEYRQPSRIVIANWPGPNPGTAAATWFERYGGQPRLVFFGPWAWFRLLDAAREEKETDLRSRFVFQHGGHSARIVFEATTVRNPFSNRDWQKFSCSF
jgi:type VI secretion system protein ImpL